MPGSRLKRYCVGKTKGPDELSSGPICLRDGRGLIVPVNLLAAFVAFLRFDRQGGDGAPIQPLQADGLAGLFTEAIAAVFDPTQRRVDFGDQLALAVAGT